MLSAAVEQQSFHQQKGNTLGLAIACVKSKTGGGAELPISSYHEIGNLRVANCATPAAFFAFYFSIFDLGLCATFERCGKSNVSGSVCASP